MSGVDERRKEVAKYMKLSKDDQRKFREKRSPAEPVVRALRRMRARWRCGPRRSRRSVPRAPQYEEDPPWFGTSACP